MVMVAALSCGMSMTCDMDICKDHHGNHMLIIDNWINGTVTDSSDTVVKTCALVIVLIYKELRTDYDLHQLINTLWLST